MLISNKVNDIKSGNKLIEKLIEPKIEKLSKSWKSAKLEKKLSKNGDLPNFKAKKKGLSFLIFETKKSFNYL